MGACVHLYFARTFRTYTHQRSVLNNICINCLDMLSLLYSTVLLYSTCYFESSCTLLNGGNKELLFISLSLLVL